jgi:hypothetical protein
MYATDLGHALRIQVSFVALAGFRQSGIDFIDKLCDTISTNKDRMIWISGQPSLRYPKEEEVLPRCLTVIVPNEALRQPSSL